MIIIKAHLVKTGMEILVVSMVGTETPLFPVKVTTLSTAHGMVTRIFLIPIQDITRFMKKLTYHLMKMKSGVGGIRIFSYYEGLITVMEHILKSRDLDMT